MARGFSAIPLTDMFQIDTTGRTRGHSLKLVKCRCNKDIRKYGKGGERGRIFFFFVQSLRPIYTIYIPFRPAVSCLVKVERLQIHNTRT